MANTYLTRSEGAGNRRTFTLSAWCKRSSTGSSNTIFSSGTNADNYFFIDFANTNKFQCLDIGSGSYQIRMETNRLIRDCNGFYHIVIAVDTTQSTASNRVKMYINGVQETSFSTATYPSQNYDTNLNNSNTANIGRYVIESSRYYDGSMSHVHFTDGTAYDATAFGEFDANGVWKIKTSPSVTYGTNGFFILKDGNSVTDQSPNTNNFTVGGGTLTNTEDSPSNVFATWNPLVHASTSAVFSNGNTKVVPQDNISVNYTTSTIAMPQSGKWYAEFKKLQNDNRLAVGIIDTDLQTGIFQANSYLKDVVGGGIIYDSINGKISGNNGDIQTGLTAAGNNAIIGLAVDMDNKLFYVYVNGSLINSGGSGASFSYLTGTYSSFWVGDVATSGYDSCEANFGNGYFGTTAVASAGTNASGNGIFEFDVPTSYTALSTKGINL